MNIILGNSFLQNSNKGCVALTLSTMYVIQQLFDRKGVQCTFLLPQSGYKTTYEGTTRVGDKDVHFKCLRDLMVWNNKSYLLRLIKHSDFNETRRSYRSADFLLDIGQGDSFSDIYGIKRFNWIDNSYKLARKYNIKYAVLPQTIGPFSEKKIIKDVRDTLINSALVLSRDKQSNDYIQEIASSVNPVEIIDVAFFLPYTKHKFDHSLIHIGLNVSALLYNGGYTKDNQFGLIVDYRRLIDEIITYFLSLEHVSIHLVPHVLSETDSIENDYTVANELYEKYNSPRLVLAPFFYTPIQAKNYISGMDYFIGSRMHSTIAAFSSGVPVFPLGYSRKFNGLFIDTLGYEAMGDMKAQDSDSLLTNIKEAFENRKNLKSIIDNRLDGVVKERRNLLETNLTQFFGL